MSLLAGLGSILGGVGTAFGAYQQNRTNNRSLDIAEQNAAQQAALSERLLDMQGAPRTNARGDRYGYQNGEWFVDLSPIGQEMQDASDVEELRRLEYDLPMRRDGLTRNFDRRTDEGVAADALLRQLGGPAVYTPEGMSAKFQQLASKGIADRYDDINNRVTTQALRSGTSAAPIIAALGEQQSDDLVSALLNAEIQGMGFGQQMEQGRTNNLLNQYNTLASRASNFDNTPFAPATAGVNAENANQAIAGGMIGAGQLSMYGNNTANQGVMQANSNIGMGPIPSYFGAAGGLLTGLDTMFGNRGMKESNTSTTDIN